MLVKTCSSTTIEEMKHCNGFCFFFFYLYIFLHTWLLSLSVPFSFPFYELVGSIIISLIYKDVSLIRQFILLYDIRPAMIFYCWRNLNPTVVLGTDDDIFVIRNITVV